MTTTYKASDGTPVTVTFDTTGQIIDAKGTGVDHIARHYWTNSANRSQQFYTEGSSPQLTVAVVINNAAQTYTVTATAGTAQLVYEVNAAAAASARSLQAATFTVTSTQLTNGKQTGHNVSNVPGPNLSTAYSAALSADLGAQYQALVQYFSPVVRQVFTQAQQASPKPASTSALASASPLASADIGQGLCMGLGAVIESAIGDIGDFGALEEFLVGLNVGLMVEVCAQAVDSALTGTPGGSSGSNPTGGAGGNPVPPPQGGDKSE